MTHHVHLIIHFVLWWWQVPFLHFQLLSVSLQSSSQWFVKNFILRPLNIVFKMVRVEIQEMKVNTATDTWEGSKSFRRDCHLTLYAVAYRIKQLSGLVSLKLDHESVNLHSCYILDEIFFQSHRKVCPRSLVCFHFFIYCRKLWGLLKLPQWFFQGFFFFLVLAYYFPNSIDMFTFSFHI